MSIGVRSCNRSRSFGPIIGAITCAIGLSGCLEGEKPLFTTSTADYPFQSRVLFQPYDNSIASDTSDEGIIVLRDAEYHLIALPKRYLANIAIGGFDVPATFILKKAAEDRYIIEAFAPSNWRREIFYGVIVKKSEGIFDVYSQIGNTQCGCGENCAASSSIKELVEYTKNIDNRCNPDFTLRISNESDDAFDPNMSLLIDDISQCEFSVTERVKKIIREHFQLNNDDDLNIEATWHTIQGPYAPSDYGDNDAFPQIMVDLRKIFDLKISDVGARKTITTPRRAIDAARKVCARADPLKKS
jgi:hypothetical protein